MQEHSNKASVTTKSVATVKIMRNVGKASFFNKSEKTLYHQQLCDIIYLDYMIKYTYTLFIIL